MTGRGVAVAVATGALVMGAASPAVAASERSRTRRVTAGSHWWDETSWEAKTTARSVRGSADSARLCARRTPKTANVRIYALDGGGRQLAALSRDRVKLGCLTLTAPRSTARFVFRLDAVYDFSGERSWSMAATR